MNKPVVRLHLFFAEDNDRALILRQGPTETFRMILWYRDTDTFEDGQWLKHKVYVERCALSPDGRHFIYFALNGVWSGEAEGSYTALSRPPYFTALALFPEDSTWGGGGRFLDNSLYVASGGADIIGRAEGLTRLTLVKADAQFPSGLRGPDGKCALIGKDKAARAFDTSPPRHPAFDLYDTMGGKLYRRDGLDLILIRDFNDMTFEPIRAPYDWRDDTTPAKPAEPWHPLQDEEPR